MKKTEEKTNALRLLDAQGVAHQTHSYDPDAVDGEAVAALTGIEPDRVFKTLVLCVRRAGQLHTEPEKGRSRRGREEHRHAAAKGSAAPDGLYSWRLLAAGHEKAVSHLH